MQITHYTNPKEFLPKVQSFLEENEALNNLILGVSFSLTKPDNAEMAAKALMLAVEDNGEVVFVAVRTPPRSLIVSAREEYAQSGSALIMKYLEEKEMEVPGVIGEIQLSTYFAEKWCLNKPLQYETIVDMGVFQLDEVINLEAAKGNFRLATDEDKDLMTKWILAFDSAHFNEQTPESARKLAKGKLENELLYFWEVDGEVVSMASGTRPTNNCMTISLVYTPQKHRKNGYARSCVAQLSQTMLDKGYQFCALFTELENPTSNKIYQEIGYYKVGEFANLKFI